MNAAGLYPFEIVTGFLIYKRVHCLRCSQMLTAPRACWAPGPADPIPEAVEYFGAVECFECGVKYDADYLRYGRKGAAKRAKERRNAPAGAVVEFPSGKRRAVVVALAVAAMLPAPAVHPAWLDNGRPPVAAAAIYRGAEAAGFGERFGIREADGAGVSDTDLSEHRNARRFMRTEAVKRRNGDRAARAVYDAAADMTPAERFALVHGREPRKGELAAAMLAPGWDAMNSTELPF